MGMALHHLLDFWKKMIGLRNEEYSTFGWIMEGLLERAGFKIEESDYKEGFLVSYLCVKSAE